MTSTLLLGDCLEVLKNTQDNSIDAVVTDPPYGLSFMGKKWDYDVPSVEIWQECLRVLKPGGYLLAFAGTRTQHRMAVRIEDAGFEIRDMIAWVYGSGFPKSLNIGKAVDKLQGNERETIGKNPNDREQRENALSDYGLQGGVGTSDLTKGTSEWEGWGTALKPALEPITVARKPLGEKTVAENVLKWGTGGINIDGCRVEGKLDGDPNRFAKTDGGSFNKFSYSEPVVRSDGRFPANLIHDGSDEVRECFPDTKSGGGNKNSVNNQKDSFLGTGFGGTGTKTDWEIDSGNASRFFKSIIYQAKASKSERNRGCEDMPDKAPAYESHRANYATTHGIETPFAGTGRSGKNFKNNHPTVKPIALMEYLVKLVSKEGATVLDPFMGSGSTGIACKNLGRSFIGVERDEEYIKIAEARIKS